jgi:hypothetical protein
LGPVSFAAFGARRGFCFGWVPGSPACAVSAAGVLSTAGVAFGVACAAAWSAGAASGWADLAFGVGVPAIVR